jgi:hypothetical protein
MREKARENETESETSKRARARERERGGGGERERVRERRERHTAVHSKDEASSLSTKELGHESGLLLLTPVRQIGVAGLVER